ncbi:D-threonine aldolase [Polystyrenella longa]|uniref:D-threonine aldolase n=1 Tax=Polystyrenella longa TaxID=2528007 RepID=A0A518CH29_9PLAN|nr:DSD1 family PLP-dependent enzyme [Polystyrenella longa]QDU78532.1 D-threonine aldolase [Polystyrenella longa]
MLNNLIGLDKFDLDTPCLTIDLDVLESNIGLMASFMKERGKEWRPHQKCHKTPAIAWKQIDAGAHGVTVAKVSEAEVFASAGIRNILIANMIVGQPKLQKLAVLCRENHIIVGCDHYVQAEMLSKVCVEYGVTCGVLVEVDIGLNRVGVRPGRDTVELARGIDKLPGIKLEGIMGYEGHLLLIEDPTEKLEKIKESVGLLRHCQEMLVKEGLCCDIVSAGGTGSYQITSDLDWVTELQAGGGIFADPFYQTRCKVDGLGYALSVMATVVSRPNLTKAVLDSGRKTINPDICLPVPKDYDDAEVVRMSAEHCELELGPKSQELKIGDKVELLVGYADFTTPLHDNFIACRNNKVEAILPIHGRGKIQ